MDNANQSAEAINKMANQYPLSGSCVGRLALTGVASSFLATLLPPDLELAPQSYTSAPNHPLLLMYNYTHLQSDKILVSKIDPNGLQMKLNYNEFIVMLPYVQFKNPAYNSDGPFCFLPVLYLDSLLAVMGGRIFWEFNKEMASFTTSDTEFNVAHELTGEPYFNSSFIKTNQALPASDVPNFIALEPILSLRVIEYGDYGYVSSIYKMDYENAVITPAPVTVTNISCKYLPPGITEIPSITDSVLGAFYMDYNWKLSYIKYIEF